MTNKMRTKIMKEETKEKMMSPMGYAKREKGESMKKEMLERIAKEKAKNAVIPIGSRLNRRRKNRLGKQII